MSFLLFMVLLALQNWESSHHLLVPNGLEAVGLCTSRVAAQPSAPSQHLGQASLRSMHSMLLSSAGSRPSACKVAAWTGLARRAHQLDNEVKLLLSGTRRPCLFSDKPSCQCTFVKASWAGPSAALTDWDWQLLLLLLLPPFFPHLRQVFGRALVGCPLSARILKKAVNP